ncbi:ISWI chromatin-remodeling complex ATPase ISW2 [Lentithecium fluviatile CBS 122367]|uniref:ISWI chromatin-remodeling complex ATPase ISW2 n=1 Tax=Lentithecium fluviatile CBS 122367 TaxID=1168545 RepID=A0A6G1JJS5_9PLEO|nr:ISWI chromatin-remodeling complex ATPase ISW2 [Lentithecium fluviatile CBS 122367]
MDEPPRVTLSLPLPITPKKRRGGHLEELLQQFGSQNSATSATKARRQLSFTPDSQQVPLKEAVAGRPVIDKRSTLSGVVSDLSNTSTSAPTSVSVYDDRGDESSEVSGQSNESPSEDELARPVRALRNAAAKYHLGELKMENRKKEGSAPRRSARNRKSDILGSDTVPQMPPTASKRKAPPRKLNTARARLRDDIAQKTKAKANNFLVANKDCFLPLLPEHNYVSKLVKNGHPSSIVKYERLQEQPEGVTAVMKPYQLDGLSFLVHLHNNGFSGILGDEMGLGKTLQTLSLFQYLEEQDRKSGMTSEELRPYLVVCPLSVLSSWVNEAQKWVPELKVLAFHGSPNERERLRKRALGMEDRWGNETLQSRDRKASKKAGLLVSKLPTEASSDSYKIIVTTYDTFQSEQSWFKHSFVWRYVVLDEGHKIKSSVTQVSTALRSIASEFRLILTGTPLQNNLVEMWALLAWLYPDVFTDNTQALFKDSFDINRGRVNRKTLDDARRLLELIMLRRMKDSAGVDLGLPPKEEVLLYVPLTPMQRFWYTRLLTRVDDTMLDDLFANGKGKEQAALDKDKQDDELLARMERLDSTNRHGTGDAWEETAQIMRQAIEKEQNASETKTTTAWRRLMNLVMQLRKCCSHPYLLPNTEPEPYYIGQHVVQASGKFILLEKLLKNSIFNQDKKVLIFSGFTQTLDYCEDMLSIISNFGQDFKSLRLDGGTMKARRKLDMKLFNDPTSEYKVMLLSTRAGGLGINLTTAEDIIFLDEDWNPQVTLQAEARAHRIGQTKKVTIYKLCTQGTVEEQMMGRIRKKLYLSAKITESMRSVHGEKAVKTSGHPSLADELPEMNTNQLKTLVRRGAQTLSHPEIDVTEMLSWDLETMMSKCRDKPADPHVNPDAVGTEIDEEQWLSVMERVECAVFDGKRYQRQLGNAEANRILPDSITREDRRKGKNTTVMIDGFAINKESLNCADWEAVPTFAGKNPRLAEPQREKRREFNHEEHCVACFDGSDTGHLVECKSCPRAYHFDCLEPEYQAKVKGFSGFFCPQHNCCECGKNTTDAGGLIYRCRWCPRGFCDDCLDDKEELVGFNLPEFEMLEEGPTAGGFYIKCSPCIEAAEEDDERKEWVEGMDNYYREQYEEWIERQEEEQQRLEKEQDAVQEARRQNIENPTANGQPKVPRTKDMGYQRARSIMIDDYDASASPPALTDTSLAVAGESGLSTPRSQAMFRTQGKKRSENQFDEEFGESRMEKRARLGKLSLSIEAHQLIMDDSSSETA